MPLTHPAPFTRCVNMSKSFGERIAELRDAKDLSMRELAVQVKISAAFVSEIENGTRYPSEDVLPRLAAALGTTVEDLKCYDHRPPTKEIQELVDLDPRFGFAFRKMVNSVRDLGLSPSDLENLVPGKKPKKKEER